MIKASIYRDKAGFSVTGRDNHGRRFRIFAKTREGARQIQIAAKRSNFAVVDRLLIAGR